MKALHALRTMDGKSRLALVIACVAVLGVAVGVFLARGANDGPVRVTTVGTDRSAVERTTESPATDDDRAAAEAARAQAEADAAAAAEAARIQAEADAAAAAEAARLQAEAEAEAEAATVAPSQTRTGSPTGNSRPAPQAPAPQAPAPQAPAPQAPAPAPAPAPQPPQIAVPNGTTYYNVTPEQVEQNYVPPTPPGYTGGITG